jgi:hypothetical protein
MDPYAHPTSRSDGEDSTFKMSLKVEDEIEPLFPQGLQKAPRTPPPLPNKFINGIDLIV